MIPKLTYSRHFLLACLIACSLNSVAQSPPVSLKCCNRDHPVGTSNIPYFGWQMNDPDDDEVQTAYQVLVATKKGKLSETEADMWDSGKIPSGMQNYISYKGSALTAARRYFWKARIWDKDGQAGPWSEICAFDTGLLENKDWAESSWIKRRDSEKEDYSFYRRSFRLPDKEILRASVYISAAHEYELFLNGKQLGKGPGYHYPQYQYYNAYDISREVTGGDENQFACLTHWYGEGQGRPENAPGLILKAIVEFSDSSTFILGTDCSWKTLRASAWREEQEKRNGEVPFFVETIDAASVIPDWNMPGYDDSSWQSALEIGPHPSPPWIGSLRPQLNRLIEEEIKAVDIRNTGTNRYLMDLGRVQAGTPRIQFSGGKLGQVVRITGGYTLEEDGRVSPHTTQRTDMSYYHVLDGDKSEFRPIGYLGMRYIQVENAPHEIKQGNFSFITRRYEMDPGRSNFHCSDSMLNKVWELMKHSILLGSQESFVDTPTREQGGFLGDSWSIGTAAMATMGDRSMNLKALLEFLDSQDQYWPDGRLNAVYPNGDGARDIPDYTQMYLFWVWDYYMHSGNMDFLKVNYEKIRKIVEYVDAHRNPSSGLIHMLEGGKQDYLFGIIDWPKPMRYGYDMETDARTLINAYACRNFRIMSRIAALCGHADDREKYRKRALDLEVAINKELINDDGVYTDGLMDDLALSSHVSQHANAIPLAMGIVPEANRDLVLGVIKAKEMSMGMVTVRWLPEALGLAGEAAHLLELYTNPEWHGWARTIARGGTATWESWDADSSGQSLSHPWGAAGIMGIQNYVLGVTIREAQHERIEVRPLDFGEDLEFAEGLIPSDRGNIKISWNRYDSLYSLKLEIPDNIRAEIYLPKGKNEEGLIKANGKDISTIPMGQYLFAGEFGSGVHHLIHRIE